MVKLPVFKKRNVHIYATIYQFKCWILFPSLSEGKNFKTSLGILTQMLTNF